MEMQNPDTTGNISLPIDKTDHIYEVDCTRFKLQAEIDLWISGWMCCCIKLTVGRERHVM